MHIGKLDKLIGIIFIGYLELVAKTSYFEVKNPDRIKRDQMVGYWHGDSYCTQLLLREIGKKIHGIKVIVTADKRGDVIQQMISHFGGDTLRIPDGFKIRAFIQELKEESKSEGSIIATALDGPVGPLHEPKKLLFLLAKESDKEMTYVHYTYSRVFRMKNRWDQYVIPLPFSKITAQIEELGKIQKEDLKNFDQYKQQLKY